MDILGWLDMQAGVDALSTDASAVPSAPLEESSTPLEGASGPVPATTQPLGESSTPMFPLHCETPPVTEGPQPQFVDQDDVPEHIRGTRYENWMPYFNRRLKRLFERRGVQIEQLRAASICTGTGPEDKVYWLHQLDYIMEFLNDNKPASYQWCKANGMKPPRHFYTDLKDLARSQEGADLLSDGQVYKFIEELKGKLHQLFAGISCKGYFMSRHGRGFSWTSRPDIWMAEAFLMVLLAALPRFASAENVMGFLKKDSCGNGCPLLRFLQRACELNVHRFYDVVVVLLVGDLFLKFTRRRVFINFYLKDENGSSAADTAIVIMEDDFKYHHECNSAPVHIQCRIIISTGSLRI